MTDTAETTREEDTVAETEGGGTGGFLPEAGPTTEAPESEGVPFRYKPDTTSRPMFWNKIRWTLEDTITVMQRMLDAVDERDGEAFGELGSVLDTAVTGLRMASHAWFDCDVQNGLREDDPEFRAQASLRDRMHMLAHQRGHEDLGEGIVVNSMEEARAFAETLGIKLGEEDGTYEPGGYA